MNENNSTFWQWVSGVLSFIVLGILPFLHRLIRGGLEGKIKGLDDRLIRLEKKFDENEKRTMEGYQRLASVEADLKTALRMLEKIEHHLFKMT